MGYWEISEMARDGDLGARVQASAAQELPPGQDPVQWQYLNALDVCAQPGWDAAWSSAKAGGNQTPGRDAAVITDGMILSGVQSVLAEQPQADG